MELHSPFVRHKATAFICLETHQCQACWECIVACPNHVIGKTTFKLHQHARIDDAAQCNGCKKCVRACPHNAIHYTYQPTKRI